MEKRNPFYYFMMERRPQVQQRLGRNLPLCELAKEVAAEWEALSGSEKARYGVKKDRRGREKLDCYGIPVRVREEEALRRKNEALNMCKHIEDTVAVHHLHEGLFSLPFYVMSSSFYLRMDEGVFVPAEITVMEFSFEQGIAKAFHAIIEPFIPVAYRHMATEHSQATHNLLPKECGDADQSVDQRVVGPAQVARDLKAFLAEDLEEHQWTLYTLQSELEHTRQILHLIVGEERLKVYSLDMLFQKIYSRLINIIPLSIATGYITECLWDYHAGIACEWHVEKERDSVRYCTMSCVKRWLYLMCRHIGMRDAFGVAPEKGKHYPAEEPVAGAVVNLAWLMQEKLSVSKDESVSEYTGATGATGLTPPVSHDAIQGFPRHRMFMRGPRGLAVLGRGQTQSSFSSQGHSQNNNY